MNCKLYKISTATNNMRRRSSAWNGASWKNCSVLRYSARNLRRPKLFGCFFSGARRLFRLRARTFGITFPNRVTVVSSADKTLLITALGFHELKVSSREQIRLRPRVPCRRQLVLQSLRTSTRSSGLFDRIIALVLDESENNKSLFLYIYEKKKIWSIMR